MTITILGLALLGLGLLWGLHWLSYDILKHKILKSQAWDLNVCCGMTDGGGVNTDIVSHANVPNLVLADPLHLPFKDKAFGRVVCSHAAEHIHDPEALLAELNRVGREVVLIVPPLWDPSACLNFFEHRWLFLSFRKVYHGSLPRYVRLPLAAFVQKRVGQRITA